MRVRFGIVGALVAIVAALPLAGVQGGDVPLSHGALVPVMELTAQNVPIGIRPGAWMDAPYDCTMAFVVEDSGGKLYITTAGHCVDFVGQTVSVRGHGAVGTVLAFRFVGAQDFALVEIFPSKYAEVNPRMAGWGGPVGVATGDVTDLRVLKHYGFGSGGTWLTHETRCRVAVTEPATWGVVSYEAFGHALWGDSGSPIVTSDGRALGLVNYLAGDTSGTFGGVRIDFAIAELESMTGLDLGIVDGGPPTDVCAGT